MDPENSIFADFQMVRLQELPEDLPAGQLPHYVEVTIMGDLVDQCRPGDRDHVNRYYKNRAGTNLSNNSKQVFSDYVWREII